MDQSFNLFLINIFVFERLFLLKRTP